MTIKRTQAAAARRGLYFDGVKKWINNCIGFGYVCHTPRGFLQADTISGFYNLVLQFPVIKEN